MATIATAAAVTPIAARQGARMSEISTMGLKIPELC
jgi:hypothetical protein